MSSAKSAMYRIERKASPLVHTECRIERKPPPPVHAECRIKRKPSPPVHAECRTQVRCIEAPPQAPRYSACGATRGERMVARISRCHPRNPRCTDRKSVV